MFKIFYKSLAIGFLLIAGTVVSASDVSFKFSGKPIYIQSEEIEEDRKKDNWSGRFGVGVQFGPDYPGAEGYRFTPALDFKASFKDKFFIENNKIGAVIHSGKMLKAGVLGRGVLSRQQQLVQTDLGGLEDVPEAFELGFFAGTSFYKMFLTAEFYFDVSEVHHGYTAELEGGYTFELNPKLTLTPILGAVWGSSSFMDTYFGVDEGASTIFEPYKAGGGLYEVYVEGALEHRLSKRWILKASLRLSELTGSAAKSPLVGDGSGSTGQLSSFVAAVWLF